MKRTSPVRIGLLAALLMLAAPALVFAGELIFHEPFDDPEADTWEVWGTAFPFNRVEVYEGALELEGSNGFEGFGAYFTPEFDLVDGALTIVVELMRNSEVPGSEIDVWFVNQYLVDGDPWMEGDFVRTGLFSTRDEVERALLVQEYSPEQRGAGKQLAIVGEAFEMGEPIEFTFTLTPDTYSVALDGEVVTEGGHSLPETTGYLLIHDWNSIDVIDFIYDVKVYQE